MSLLEPTRVHEWLTRTAGRLPDKTALICGGQSCTYGRLDSLSDKLAAVLLGCRFKPQDRVVVFLDNSIETVISLYGILKAGGVFAIVNTVVKSEKLAYILDNADASVLIAHTSKARVVLEAIGDLKQKPDCIWVHPLPNLPKPLGDAGQRLHWEALLAQADTSKVVRPRIAETDIAALIYTSGSTGHPKGVIQPHGRMVSVCRSIIQYLANTQEDVILNVLSLSFGYGLYQVLMSVIFGGTVIIEKSFVYLHDILLKFGRLGVTGFPIVPTIAAMLLDHQEIDQYDFSRLRYITSAGAALPAEYSRRMRRLWPHVGIIPMHGLTECVRTCYLPADQIDDRPDSVGHAIPGCTLSIVDEQGNEVSPGTVGEMVVSGFNVMSGYWKDPELTAKIFRTDSQSGQTRLYTGDLFRRDAEGFLYFVGRKDDMIKCRGERVSPKEIEDVLCRLPGVMEAAVVGVPDPILGQAPRAYIVRQKDAALTDNDVLLFVSQHLEPFMIPKTICWLTELPKTPNGKIDKKQLREQD